VVPVTVLGSHNGSPSGGDVDDSQAVSREFATMEHFGGMAANRQLGFVNAAPFIWPIVVPARR